MRYGMLYPACYMCIIFQASGEAEYVSDIPPRPGQLYAAFVLSTQGNATIDNIDPADALVSCSLFVQVGWYWLNLMWFYPYQPMYWTLYVERILARYMINRYSHWLLNVVPLIYAPEIWSLPFPPMCSLIISFRSGLGQDIDFFRVYVLTYTSIYTCIV